MSKECSYCFGSPDPEDGDFCLKCGQPSRAYRDLIENDMRRNGESDEVMAVLVVGP